MTPLISICIPAYKRTDFLKRLFDSISIQTFKDFEVILTDDSQTDDVAIFCKQYEGSFKLSYHKNLVSLGTPENWNESIRKATGKWIKIMHDDDWFSDKESLGIFAEIALKSSGNFIFSSYKNVFLDEEQEVEISPTKFRLRQLKRNPVSLLSKNIIGPPSVTLCRNNHNVFYDKDFKWLVDIDFYCHILAKEEIFHIDKHLVNVGMSREQVTAYCHTNPMVEIPENYYFLKKIGVANLENILVYDSWWRLLRNFNIKNELQLRNYVNAEWPLIVLKILKDINKTPKWVLKIGVFSKMFMAFSYLKNKQKI